MSYLLDTDLLLWAAADSARLPAKARAIIEDESSVLAFSVASIWEVAIKTALGRPDFEADPHQLRRGLLSAGYAEVEITGAHAAAVVDLPPLHRDPFDRILVCQARADGLLLVTGDPAVARYSAEIQLV